MVRVLFFLGVLFLVSIFDAHAKKHGRELIDSLVASLPKLREDTMKVKVLRAIGITYSSIDPGTGIKYLNQGSALAEKLEWPTGIATLYNALGICCFYKSDYAMAISYWKKALQIYERTNDKQGVLQIIGNLGAIYESQGDYPSAIENHLLALKYAEELGDKQGIVINLSSIASSYEYLKEYQKALTYGFKALRMAEKMADTPKIAVYVGNIGNTYKDMANYPEALKYLFTALKYDEGLDNNEGVARNLDNIAATYIKMKRYDTALVYLFRALELSKNIGFKVAQSTALYSIGETFIFIAEEGRPASLTTEFARKYGIPANKAALLSASITYLQQSIAIDLETNNLNEQMENYVLLARAQTLIGDHKGALENTLRSIGIKDSIFSMAGRIKIANLETRREMELKDKQLEIDRLEVEKKRNIQAGLIGGIVLLLVVAGIGYRNIKLRAAREVSENKLNAFQARMNPHFIFNSLNSIQSLMLNNEVIPSITYLSEFSKLMRQILDSSAKSKVLLSDEVQMLRSYISLEQLRYNNFQWQLRLGEHITADSIYVPGMILQPFVENAIVHGFQPENTNGQLDVHIEREGDQLVCTVDDNGVGRKRSAEINLERGRTRQSHGINIATDRLALLNNRGKGLVNSVTYIDKQKNGIATGTTVIVKMPIL